MKHTPGPWEVKKIKINRNKTVTNVEGEGDPICKVFGPEDLEPNAKLIAAAPELLEALEDAALTINALFDDLHELTSDIDGECVYNTNETLDKINNAIRKATGD